MSDNQPDASENDLDLAADLSRAMEEIWIGVFQLPEIGRNADFFALGGDSLLGMRILARVADRCDVELSLSDLFENPTPDGCAAVVNRRRRAAAIAAE